MFFTIVIYNFYMKKCFPERLKELREESGLTVLQLSKETKISKSALYRWENGEADVRSEYLIILAKYFKVSTDYLLGLED